MTAAIIDGKAAAVALRGQVAAEVARLGQAHDLQPGLAVVLVGEDPASQVYVRNKGRQTVEAGMLSHTHRLDGDTSEADLLALVAELNADPTV
ncbi:MAG TPA: bifunctional methylenetetrahydrofolate dehydrogenase/methenyltetrahydrofolate cyclohydrolase, partial [Halieaceae bacterium]|nr:bifunctional methylenetetrahydrofolate dehydrogenase/methenyltetrahydrofolate cyclohydrolase [Halieaceae bacterium]